MKDQLLKRTKNLSVSIIKFVERHSGKILSPIANQIIRSSTSVGANYRAACRAKSTADFLNKLKIVEEEADETIYWLEIIEETQSWKNDELLAIKIEANEILSIIVASIKTIRRKMKEQKK